MSPAARAKKIIRDRKRYWINRDRLNAAKRDKRKREKDARPPKPPKSPKPPKTPEEIAEAKRKKAQYTRERRQGPDRERLLARRRELRRGKKEPRRPQQPRPAKRKYSPEEIRAMFRLDYCLCGAPLGKEYEIDHSHPRSRGGSDAADNQWLLCTPCNREKGSKTTDEFIAWRALVGRPLASAHLWTERERERTICTEDDDASRRDEATSS